ncbi:MAG: DUF6265 family protein [Bacteroidota bacterium]
MRIRLYLSIMLLSLLSIPMVSAQSNKATLSDLQWVIGTWKRESAKSITYEHWRQQSNRTLEGESYRIVKATGDTAFGESLMLVEMAGEVFYISKVPENKYPVAFKLASLEKGTAVFENPAHDFPQRIIYTQNADGSMTAAIEGPGESADKPKRIEFPFQRVSK